MIGMCLAALGGFLWGCAGFMTATALVVSDVGVFFLVTVTWPGWLIAEAYWKLRSRYRKT